MRSHLLALAMLCVSAMTEAQVNGSVATVSDYRYRGLTFSNGNPAAQLTLNYDHLSGWYAGAFTSTIKLPQSNASQNWMTYMGYTQQLDTGWSWDVGTKKMFFPQTANQLSFSEMYAGISFDKFNTRLSYSPNYLGANARSIYAEFNGGYPLSESWALLGHIGFLRSFQSQNGNLASTRSDTRFGLGYHMRNWDFQLAWITVRNPASGSPSSPDAAVFSAVYKF